MRVLLAAPCLLIVGVLTGCPPIETKIPSSTTFDVPGSGILDPSPLAPELAFPTDVVAQALADSISQSLDTSGYDKGAVTSLKLTKLTLTVEEPNNPGGVQIRGLGFLESLVIFLGAPGGAPVQVAASGAGAFDDNPVSYDMPLSGAELAAAFKASDALEMSADVSATQPQFATTVDVNSEITVQIGL